MGFHHFAIEQERNVSVKAFLQLVQTRIGAVPSIGLVHHEYDFIAFHVVRDQIDDADTIGMFDV